MTRQEFKKELIELAKRRATYKDYGITLVAMTDLEELIESGVNRMTLSELDSSSSRVLAENNLRKIIDEMANDAKSRRLYESLDYKSFVNVRSSICPLWPFC